MTICRLCQWFLFFLYFEVDGALQQPHYSVNIKCPMNAQQTAVKPSTNCISYELLIRLMRRLVMDALQFYIVYNPLSSSFYCHCCCCHSQHACLRTNFIQCVLNNNLRIVINKTWPSFFFPLNLLSFRVLGAFLLGLPEGHEADLQPEVSAHGPLRQELGTA